MQTHTFFKNVALLVLGGFTALASHAQTNRSVQDWLSSMHLAAQSRSYVGTFVVSSNQGMSTARIWHACDGQQQMERVEALSGAPRTTLRHNDKVVVFSPQERVAIMDRRENLGLFATLLQSHSIPEHYAAKLAQSERVAGLDTQVIELAAKDPWRFSHKVWIDKDSGLVIKVQTLEPQGQVLEESAFSEIQVNAPVKMENIARLMRESTDEARGIRVVRPELVKADASALGWSLRQSVPGFKTVGCYQRGPARADQASAMQWVFSDGLASLSIFAQPYDSRKHGVEMMARFGATYTYGRRLDNWWLTFMGEVPMTTLKAFSDALERRK